MKSTNSNKINFTIEDFEKGLMLAGYISPNSISDLHERELLEKHEEKLKAEKREIYFKRTVLAAEIANQLHTEPTLGHVKFQKLVFLCEHESEMNLGDRYSKQAAGPFDKGFMHTIDAEFKKQKWFSVEIIKENGYTKFKYLPLENNGEHKKYYESYFKNFNERIQYIINIFRKEKTDFVEIAATLYACLVELKNNGIDITNKNLIELFYNWSKEKQRFTESQVLNIYSWMQEKGITPENSAS